MFKDYKMKELSDNELIQMPKSEFKKMDKYIWSQTLITILVITQAVFVIIDVISILTYFLIFIGLMILYYKHRISIKVSEIKCQEILKELQNREI